MKILMTPLEITPSGHGLAKIAFGVDASDEAKGTPTLHETTPGKIWVVMEAKKAAHYTIGQTLVADLPIPLYAWSPPTT